MREGVLLRCQEAKEKNMKLEELFKKVEAYNEIAEQLNGNRIVIRAELVDNITKVSFPINDERFSGSKKPYFLTWKGFKENLLDEYSLECNKLVRDVDLVECSNGYTLCNNDTCKDIYLRFEIAYR